MNIDDGKVICLLGPNGAGKTTTIKLLGTFVKPSTGEFYYNSININDRAKYLKHISVLFEGVRSIVWYLKPCENVEYFCGIRGMKYLDYKDLMEYYLEYFDLTKYFHQTGNELSRGNQQKLALSCVFSLNTNIILLDEATLGLDFESSEKLMELIKKEAREKIEFLS